MSTALRPVSDKLRTLADALLELAHETAGETLSAECDATGLAKQSDMKAAGELADTARRIYAERRDRERYFDAALFREPAWDILLDLFIQRSEKRRVSVTSAAIASNVPMSTALRYLARLEAAGLVQRLQCASDDRVVFLELTQLGVSRMTAYLANCTTKLLWPNPQTQKA